MIIYNAGIDVIRAALLWDEERSPSPNELRVNTEGSAFVWGDELAGFGEVRTTYDACGGAHEAQPLIGIEAFHELTSTDRTMVGIKGIRFCIWRERREAHQDLEGAYVLPGVEATEIYSRQARHAVQTNIRKICRNLPNVKYCGWFERFLKPSGD